MGAVAPDGDLLDRLRTALATSLGLAPLLDGARLTDDGSDLLTLTYAHDHARIGQMLERGDKLERVAAALTDVLGRTVLLTVAYDEAPDDAGGGTAQSPPGSYVESPPPCPDETPRPPKPDPREVGLPPKAGEVATDAGKGPVNVDDDPLIRAVIDELGGEVVKVE